MQSIYSLRFFQTLQFSDTSKRERATHCEIHRNAFIHINTHRVSKAAACERAQRSTEILAGGGGGKQEQGRETEVHVFNHNFEKLNGYKMKDMCAGTEGGLSR